MDQTDLTIFVILLKIVIFVQAVVLAHLTFSAYRRSGETDLVLLSIAFSSIVVGVLLEGAVTQVFGLGLLVGSLIESVFVALALGVMIYSLYG